MSKIHATILFGLAAVFALGLYLDRTSGDDFLKFATWGTVDELRAYQKLVNLYNSRNPPRRVRLIHVELQYDQKLLVQAAGNSVPDVFKAYNGMIKSFGRKGVLEDLAPWVAADTSIHLDQYYDVLVRDGYDGRRLYGLPLVFSTLVLYYNRDLFDAAGLSYPDSTWTWDEVIRAGKKLTRRDDNGNVIRWGGHLVNASMVMIYQYGGDHFNDRLDRCVVGSAEAAEALAKFISFYRDEQITFDPAVRRGYHIDEMFSSGQAAMVVNGRWAAPWLSRNMRPGSFDVAPMPHAKKRVTGLAAHYVVMAASSHKKKDAWDFMKFLVSEEAQRITSEDGNNIPAMRRVAESDVFLHNKVTPWIDNRVFLDQLPYAREWWWEESPYVSPYEMNLLWFLAMDRAARREQTPLEALRQMEDEVNRLIASQMAGQEGRPFLGSRVFLLLLLAVVAGGAWISARRHRTSTQELRSDVKNDSDAGP